MGLLEELQWRGMVSETTEGLGEALEREKVTAYIGFDPTAASLHVGNLMTLMGLARLQRYGHTPLALVGGGTGLIGDPSGKRQERTLQTFEQIEQNAHAIRKQLERFLDFNPALPNAARLRNNVEWLRPIGFLDFLRDVGKYFTVNYMMAKESVKRRIEGEEGISFTEFSYQLLQAYDYLVLFDRETCTLQMGGSDQWGNITAGCDLIRKMRGARAHGLVWPLLTTATGAKFGKTESGTIWLDAELTSPFRFYQFWLNTDDRDVIKYLKFFTWLDREAIAALEGAVARAPEQREAQRTLAREVTLMVHGAEGLAEAERETAAHFGGGDEDAVPAITLAAAQFAGGMTNTEFMVSVGLASSKGEAARLIKQGGFYINDERITDERGRVTLEHVVDGKIRARKGQRERRIVRLEQ
jgi:tyrosyl-tRNA synthetase